MHVYMYLSMFFVFPQIFLASFFLSFLVAFEVPKEFAE